LSGYNEFLAFHTQFLPKKKKWTAFENCQHFTHVALVTLTRCGIPVPLETRALSGVPGQNCITIYGFENGLFWMVSISSNKNGQVRILFK